MYRSAAVTGHSFHNESAMTGLVATNSVIADSLWKECPVTAAERFVFLYFPDQGLPETRGICRGQSSPDNRPRGVPARAVCVHCTFESRYFAWRGGSFESITDAAVVVRI